MSNAVFNVVDVAPSNLTPCGFQDEEDEEEEDEDDDEDDDEEDEGSDEEVEGEDYAKLPQVDTILYRDGQQPPLPPSPVSQPPPPPLQTVFVPIQPLPEYNPADYPGSTSPELQRVLVGQHMLGQQQAGLGAGMLAQQAPDGLMVATPAQTLTDTLDDIMAGEYGASSALCVCGRHTGENIGWVTDVFSLLRVTDVFSLLRCSGQQPCAHAEHYHLAHAPVTATHADAR